MARRISLTQYLVEQQREHGHIPAELRLLIEVVARACKTIAISVNKGALGDVLGSNLFDILVVTVDDIIFTRGPILAHVSPVHVVSAMSAVMMTGIVIVGLLYRPKTRLFRAAGWASLLLLGMYLLNSFVLYLHGT